MSWYWSKWWRFATSPSRSGVMLDGDGRWVHLLGPIWWLTDRACDHQWGDVRGEGCTPIEDVRYCNVCGERQVVGWSNA